MSRSIHHEYASRSQSGAGGQQSRESREQRRMSRLDRKYKEERKREGREQRMQQSLDFAIDLDGFIRLMWEFRGVIELPYRIIVLIRPYMRVKAEYKRKGKEDMLFGGAERYFSEYNKKIIKQYYHETWVKKYKKIMKRPVEGAGVDSGYIIGGKRVDPRHLMPWFPSPPPSPTPPPPEPEPSSDEGDDFDTEHERTNYIMMLANEYAADLANEEDRKFLRQSFLNLANSLTGEQPYVGTIDEVKRRIDDVYELVENELARRRAEREERKRAAEGKTREQKKRRKNETDEPRKRQRRDDDDDEGPPTGSVGSGCFKMVRKKGDPNVQIKKRVKCPKGTKRFK